MALDLRRFRRSMIEAGEVAEDAREMGTFGGEPVVPAVEFIVHLFQIISRGRCRLTPKASRFQFHGGLTNHRKELTSLVLMKPVSGWC